MTEVTTASAGVSQVVWFPLKVSVKFSCHHRASGPHVPDSQGFFRQVVVLERSEDIFGGVIEIIIQVLVAIVVVIF